MQFKYTLFARYKGATSDYQNKIIRNICKPFP